MPPRSARLSSLVQVFLLTVKEITSLFAIVPLLTQRRLFSHSFSGLLPILNVISAPLSLSLLLALIYFYLHIWKQNPKKPADFPFAWLFECGPFQPPWWISRCSGEGNTQRRIYTTHAEPFRLRFIVRLPARPVSQRCFLITCSHTLSVLCTFVRLILKQKQDGEELKLIQPNWLITSWKSFLCSLNVPWFPLPTRCPLPGRDKVCRLLSYLAYS